MRIRAALVSITLLFVYILQPALAKADPLGVSSLTTRTLGQDANSIPSNEASIALIVRYIHAAEATFQATAGNGRFGTLQQLFFAKLIDAKLRTGFSNGYRLALTVSNPPNSHSTFELTARPQTYMETGVRTFSITEIGVIRVSYEPNPKPAQMQVNSDSCESVGCTEAFARLSLRTIAAAEATFQATAGAGKYGTLEELGEHNLIPDHLARGIQNGYAFQVRVDNGGKNEPASFHAIATPVRYVITGVFSFYIDETGILRGGNKNGGEADGGDDPVCG